MFYLFVPKATLQQFLCNKRNNCESEHWQHIEQSQRVQQSLRFFTGVLQNVKYPDGQSVGRDTANQKQQCIVREQTDENIDQGRDNTGNELGGNDLGKDYKFIGTQGFGCNFHTSVQIFDKRCQDGKPVGDTDDHQNQGDAEIGLCQSDAVKNCGQGNADDQVWQKDGQPEELVENPLELEILSGQDIGRWQGTEDGNQGGNDHNFQRNHIIRADVVSRPGLLKIAEGVIFRQESIAPVQ